MANRTGRICLLTLLLLGAGSSQAADGKKAPLFGVGFYEDCRTWTAVAPSHRTDKNLMRMMLANPTMVQAFRDKTIPFPDGSVMAKFSYKAVQSPTWKDAIVPGEAVTVEFIVKDSKKYPDTGGWGYGRFTPAGEPVGDVELYKTCFPCHERLAGGQDYVFTHWAP
jgi:hypothetical protein